MPEIIAENEPDYIIAGFTSKWKKYYPDYLPDTWTLKYALKKTGTVPVTFSSTADNDYHLIELSATASAAYEAGNYQFQAYVENESTGEKLFLEAGSIEIKASFMSAASNYDPRSHAQKCLDAIKAVIEGRASQNQAEVKVGDKELKYYSFSQLLTFKEYYEDQVKAEIDQARLDAGETLNNNALYIEFI